MKEEPIRCNKDALIDWHWNDDIVPVCFEHQGTAASVSRGIGIPPHFTERSEVGKCTQVISNK